MLHMTDAYRPIIESNVDEYGDSYCRDVSADELKGVWSHTFKIKNYTDKN
jgi:DNA ligase-4